MNDPLMTVEGLSVEFQTREGRVHALQDVSFSLGRGEIVGVVGESGSGKSVLSYTIMGLLDPAARILSGAIRFDNTDILGDRKRIASLRGRALSMIFQSPRTALNPIMRVGVQLGDVLIRHRGVARRAARQAAIDALRRVRIADSERCCDAYPFELSGGTCQRVMIAMALAGGPSLLIADEPTTGLDVTTQAVVMDLIRDVIADTKMTTILITHDLALAGEYCDRILVMHAGHLIESAWVTDFPAALKHPYSKRLFAATPSGAATLSDLGAIPGTLPDLRGDLPYCRYRARCERAAADCDSRPLPTESIAPGHLVRCWHPG